MIHQTGLTFSILQLRLFCDYIVDITSCFSLTWVEHSVISFCRSPSTSTSDELFVFKYCTIVTRSCYLHVGILFAWMSLATLRLSLNKVFFFCFPTRLLLTACAWFIPPLSINCSERKFDIHYGNKWKNKLSCHLLYTDGVFRALFTPVSNQIGAVSSVQELHLSLVSLHRPCKPEPPKERLLHLNCNQSLWTWGWGRSIQSIKRSKDDLWLLLTIYSHLFLSLTRAGQSNRQVLEPGTEKNCGYFVS